MKFDILEKVVDPTALENGVWFPVMMPGSMDDPLFADADRKKPCRVLVRSRRSKTFVNLNLMYNARVNGQIGRAKVTERARLQAEGEVEQRAEWFSWLLASMENVSTTSVGVVTPEREELVAFAREASNQWFVDQVIAYAFADGNFGFAEQNPPSAGEKVGKASKG